LATTVAETGATLSVLDILAATAASAYLTQTISSLLNPTENRWEGKLIYELNVSSSLLPPLLPEVSGVQLELEAFNGYQGSWAIGTLGTSTTPLLPSESFPVDYTYEQDVVMYTPRWVGTNSWVFSGFATTGKVDVPGFSGRGLIVGFGKGYTVDLPSQSAYPGFGIYVGFSVPIPNRNW